MTDTLFEYNHLLMRSEYRTPDIHSHLAVHLIAGLGTGLHCTVADESFDADAVFIASDIPHTAFSDSGEMLVFLFDPASHYANEIEQFYLRRERFACLSRRPAEQIMNLWSENRDSILQADRAILESLGLSNRGDVKMDRRVAEVLAVLKETEEISADEVSVLCKKVCLSQSRLSHLFKENLGISLSRYLAWEKMRKGFIYFRKYGNITDAAMRAGFDSPSHFAATCKRMFGISFSEYAKS